MAAGSRRAHGVRRTRQMWVDGGKEFSTKSQLCVGVKALRPSVVRCLLSSQPASRRKPTEVAGACRQGWRRGRGVGPHRLTFVSLSKPAQVARHLREKTLGVAGGSVNTWAKPPDLCRTFLPYFFLLISCVFAFPFVSVSQAGRVVFRGAGHKGSSVFFNWRKARRSFSKQ